MHQKRLCIAWNKSNDVVHYLEGTEAELAAWFAARPEVTRLGSKDPLWSTAIMLAAVDVVQA